MILTPNVRKEASAILTLPERLYTRFAEVSLEVFRSESTFPMVVPQGQDVDLTVRKFERLACAIELGPEDRWITVTCPSA